MANAISYVRFSSSKQSLGDSLRRQLERTKDYCEKHGLTLDETLTDAGLSGFTGEHVKHGQLGRFLTAVKAGLVPHGTYLILEHLDRFSRDNPNIAMQLLLGVINAGIRVVTLFNEHVYSDASKTMSQDLIGAVLYLAEAHQASERKSDLLKQTWDGKRAKIASGASKMLTRTRPAWVDIGPNGFIRNTQGARIVRRIFEDVASGLSTYVVCRRLNEASVPTLTGDRYSRKTGEKIGNGWNTARISEIIRSDTPLGWFQAHKFIDGKRVKVGEPQKGYYPKVVSQELADRARANLKSREFGGEGSGRTGEFVTNLFTGLVRCGVCGSPMHLYNYGKVIGRNRRARWQTGYLRCSRNKRNMQCENAGSIPYAEFERFATELLGGFSVPETGDETNHVMRDLTERLAEAKADVTKTQDSVRMLLDAFVSGASPLVMARIGELEAQHVKLRSVVADLEKQIEAERGRSKPSDAIQAVKTILADVEATDPNRRLLARTRVAAGMKRFIRHFLCFPNRGFIAEYDLGDRGSVMGCIRAWLTPGGEYEVYHADWDYGQRNGKTWLTAPVENWERYIRDYEPLNKLSRYARLRFVAGMEREKKQSAEGFQFPARIAASSPSHLDLQPEDVIVTGRPPTGEKMQEAKDFLQAIEQGPEAAEEFLRKRREGRP